MKNYFILGIFLLCSLGSKSQVTNFSFTNKPFSDPELPNYHRGAQYWNGTSWGTGAAPQVPPGNPTTGAKALYSRYWWSDCERGEGQYTFTKASLGNDWWKSIEASLEWCANNGAMYTFGNIMTSWDGEGTIFYDGGWAVYPQYLHNLMQAEATTKDWKYANGNIWVPNWNSPSYLARWRALQDTAKRYIENWKFTPTSGPWAGRQVLGKNIFEYVDLRGFGNYGEWHTYPWGDDGSEPAYAKATDSTFKKLIDIGAEVWTNYPLHIPVGAFDDNPWGEGTAFTTWYVLTRKTNYGVIGWRRDNIGDVGLDGILIGNTFTGPNGWKADTAILDRWKFATITGEPLNGNGTCCPYYWHVRFELNNYHYAAFGNGNYGSTAQSVFDSMQVYFKMSGYRFNLNGGSMTTGLIQNSNFDVNLNWRNVGVSPLYQKRWRVVYQLKTSGDVEIKRWVSKFNPYLFLPSNKDSIVSETFNLGNVALGNTYKLTIKFEDTVGLLSPLFLAVNSPGRNSDGSYTLRSNISVTSGTLPITWYSFSAKKKSNHVDLIWSTSCDPDNQKFEIGKSSDGLNFQTIGTLPAQTNCLSANYNFKDYNITVGNFFYRIKQLDFDGNSSYSPIVKISISGSPKNSNFFSYGNPVTEQLILTINTEDYGEARINIFSPDGKLVKKLVGRKLSPFYTLSVDISDLSNGMYIAQAYVANRFIGTEKILKH